MALLNTLKFLSIGFTAMTLCCTSASAYNDEYYNFTVGNFDTKIRPIIQSLLPASQRQTISNIDIIILPSFNLPTVAMTQENPPKVFVSLGFLDGLFQHIDCLLLETSLSVSNDGLCEAYFAYFFSEAIDNTSPHPDTVAVYILGGKNGAVDKWHNDSEMSTTRDQMMYSALIFLFMHEFGHHITGFYDDNDSLSDKRKVEAASDTWANQALARMNERPILGAAISLGYIARMEAYRKLLADAARNDPTFIQIDSPHPHPKDRVEWGFERYCNASLLVDNPSMQQPCGMIQDMINGF